MPIAARLVQLANRQGHQLCVAPATQDDLLQGRDAARRRQRLAELEKFQLLEEVDVSDDLTARAGKSRAGTSDHRDLRVLAALEAGAADYLVTEDDRLRRRAARAGIRESVFSLSEIVDLLSADIPGPGCVPSNGQRPVAHHRLTQCERPTRGSLGQGEGLPTNPGRRVCFQLRKARL